MREMTSLSLQRGFDPRNYIRSPCGLRIGSAGLSQEGSVHTVQAGSKRGGADVHRHAIFFKDGCRGKGGHGTVAADGLHGPAGV